MITAPESLDFALRAELEAHEPPEARGLRRDQVRLLITADGGKRIVHTRFTSLPEFFEPGDLLVANDSATLPAALKAHRPGGSAFDLHLSTNLYGDIWVVEPRKAEAVAGDVLLLPDGGRAMLFAPYHRSERLWVAGLKLPAPALEYLGRWGRPIAYSYVKGEWPLAMYQTVYAAQPGSAETPSAGRPFSPKVLGLLAQKGVGFAALTLHTGVSSQEHDEPPYKERFVVPPATADAVMRTKAAGHRVVAIGTTVVRALESVARKNGIVVAGSGWTDLVITPEREMRAVDGLLTGFHEPKSSHLAMLEAIAGREHIRIAYDAALGGGYLWHEFGDVHLILP